MHLPDYIDNQTHTLETILKQLIEEQHQLTLDIATGFFRIEAWVRLEKQMNRLNSLRLLIGRDPAIRPAESDRIDLERHFRKHIQEQLDQQDFTLSYKSQIERMIAYLQRQDVQVRLFGALGEKSQFLHAKAYIFDNYSIIGSSNFTPSGLEGNTELNVINKVSAIAHDLRHNWFEKFWDDPSVDLEYKTKLIDALNASKFGSKAYTPYQVFLRALYELFKNDSLTGEGITTTLELASFQQEGFERAIKLIEKHRGCMVADAVGLGKTFIGLRVLEYYLTKLRKPGYVPRALVVCPAQLRDLVWNKKLDEFGVKAKVISHEEVSRKTFEEQIREYNQYDLVVVDECHNFRNSATNRYRNLLKLVSSGQRTKRLLLLTATPINNSIYDLYHQISLFTRGSDVYYREDGISNLKSYFKDLAKGGVESTELLMQTMVRRSRQDVIKRQQAGEEIRINGQLIHFPKRELEQFTYNFEESFTGLYIGIANQIDELHLAPYNIKAFKKRKQKEDETEVKRNEALVALQKALYLKRFESSLIAFNNSIKNQRDFQTKFYELLVNQGKLLNSKIFRKLILAAELDDDDAEESLSAIIDQLDEIDPKDYQIDSLRSQIESDLSKLNGILNTLSKIKESVESSQDHDKKLEAFKELLLSQLKGQKILVFSYFKDTADYLYTQLIQDQDWLTQMGKPIIELITGATPANQRKDKVQRFAPQANTENDEERDSLQDINILICTDVLSEGQNLQDAGVLVNYDLHWNPVRMIQRAGRIDRLGTDYDTLSIYNCFPEEGLEELLGLVRRLQERIATIDREVGLDASVLGETISERSLEELYRLKRASTEAEKAAILEELEQRADLVSLDEMRLPLLEFIQAQGHEIIQDIPLGIHSTKIFKIPDPHFTEGGLFMAFKADDKHFWQCYPRVQGHIIAEPSLIVTDKRKIFNWIKCSASDYPPPEQLPPVEFDKAIFRILEGAVDHLLEYFKKQHTGSKVKPQLTKLLQKINVALSPDLFTGDNEVRERIRQVITGQDLKAYERELRRIWDKYVSHKDLNELISELDEFLIENQLYDEIEQDPHEKRLRVIERKDIQLVCFEWIKPLIFNTSGVLPLVIDVGDNAQM